MARRKTSSLQKARVLVDGHQHAGQPRKKGEVIEGLTAVQLKRLQGRLQAVSSAPTAEPAAVTPDSGERPAEGESERTSEETDDPDSTPALLTGAQTVEGEG